MSATDVVAANVITDVAGKVLLVRETKRAAKGRWGLPGGRVETGETLREAARREAREETGFDVEPGDLLGIFHAPSTLEGGSAVMFAFHSTVIGGSLTTSAEHPEVEWFDRDAFTNLIEVGMVRGRHAALALESLDAGRFLPSETVSVVEASPPPSV